MKCKAAAQLWQGRLHKCHQKVNHCLSLTGSVSIFLLRKVMRHWRPSFTPCRKNSTKGHRTRGWTPFFHLADMENEAFQSFSAGKLIHQHGQSFKRDLFRAVVVSHDFKTEPTFFGAIIPPNLLLKDLRCMWMVPNFHLLPPSLTWVFKGGHASLLI